MNSKDSQKKITTLIKMFNCHTDKELRAMLKNTKRSQKERRKAIEALLQ